MWGWGSGGQLASTRPGAVRAPLGGPGHFLALTISKGAGTHAHIAAYGPRWPPGTRRDLDAISILTRVEIAPRSRRVPGGHLGPYTAIRACGLAPGHIISARKCRGPPGGARTAPGRALAFCGVRPAKGQIVECAAGRAPPGGLRHFLALTISKGARPHARVAAYGRRCPFVTRRDLGAISILKRNRDLYEIA